MILHNDIYLAIFIGLFCFRMEFVMYFLEVGVGDVGVDLRGGYISMAKHGLDSTEIGSVHKKVCSKRMP